MGFARRAFIGLGLFRLPEKRRIFSRLFGLTIKQQAFRPAVSLPAGGTLGAHFAEREKWLIFALAKRGRAQALPLFAFLGQTILYERKNYLI